MTFHIMLTTAKGKYNARFYCWGVGCFITQAFFVVVTFFVRA